MSTSAIQPRKVVPWVLGLAALIIGIVLYTGREDGYIVKVEFADAGGVRKNSEVKIAEAPAGKVVDIDLTKRDTAMVTLKMDDGAWPIGTGASARSRPVNLLGEKYVDLRPGDLKRPVPSGSVIPDSRTATAVEIDDVLNTLDPSVRARLRILIGEAGVAMAGRGTDFNQVLESLPHSLDEGSRFLGQLSKDTGKLDELIVKGDRVLSAVATRKEDLGTFIDSADKALAVTADQRKELERTVASAPGGLRQLRSALGELGSASAALRPAAANLTKTTRPLASTLERLPGFANDTKKTLAVARKVAPSLARLGTEGTPTVRRLRPTLNRLSSFATSLAPNVTTFDEGGAKDVIRWATNWANVTEGQDGIGHVFRDRVFVGRDFFSLPNAEVRKTARRTSRPAAKAADPAPAPPADRPAAKKPALALPKLPKLPVVSDALPKVTTTVDSILKKILPNGTAPAPAPGGSRGEATDNDALHLFDYLLGG
jgi:phospholipid/cholesterol/gamma-HCH transport system substrate-binding protein